MSDKNLAGPTASAIVDFAKMRGLRLEDADVLTWQESLASLPTTTQDVIAKVRNEALEEAENACIEQADMLLKKSTAAQMAMKCAKCVRALKTEVK
jgi:hypothetical protein